MLSSSVRSYLPLKVILSLLPTVVFWQDYAWISSNHWLAAGFIMIWVLLIISTLNLADKNRVIEKLLRLTEIAFFLLPLSIIVLTLVTASHGLNSTSSSLEQGAALVGIIAGGFVGMITAFAVGIAGGLVMHLLARNYEKKVDKQSKQEKDRFGVAHVILAVIVLAIASTLVPTVQKENNLTHIPVTQSSPEASSADTSFLAENPDTTIQGNLVYAVLKVFKEKEIKNSFSTTSANGRFHIVVIAIGNMGDATDTVSISQFSVIDDQGRTYDPSSEGQFAANLVFGSGETTIKDLRLSNLTFQQVQPSLPIKGLLVFDLPDEATHLKLQVKKDILSKGSTIDLQPFEETTDSQSTKK